MCDDNFTVMVKFVIKLTQWKNCWSHISMKFRCDFRLLDYGNEMLLLLLLCHFDLQLTNIFLQQVVFFFIIYYFSFNIEWHEISFIDVHLWLTTSSIPLDSFIPWRQFCKWRKNEIQNKIIINSWIIIK